ncbi:MAG: division/cell wall cluster transcriptional repressor MraZ [Treponema sp.]|jgi:MraZ protein|nr:division/cell wall cluster transcriptional repressor MraZ [Treponema sp.]
MVLLTGTYKSTLDDKGRVSLPARLRSLLPQNLLFITEGIQDCLWVFPPEQWESVSEKMISSAAVSLEKLSLVQYRFISPSQELEIDRAGRIAVPASLREFAGLNRDCMILGLGKSIEIWDLERFNAFQEANRGRHKEILEEMGPMAIFR